MQLYCIEKSFLAACRSFSNLGFKRFKEIYVALAYYPKTKTINSYNNCSSMHSSKFCLTTLIILPLSINIPPIVKADRHSSRLFTTPWKCHLLWHLFWYKNIDVLVSCGLFCSLYVIFRIRLMWKLPPIDITPFNVAIFNTKHNCCFDIERISIQRASSDAFNFGFKWSQSGDVLRKIVRNPFLLWNSHSSGIMVNRSRGLKRWEILCKLFDFFLSKIMENKENLIIFKEFRRITWFFRAYNRENFQVRNRSQLSRHIAEVSFFCRSCLHY